MTEARITPYKVEYYYEGDNYIAYFDDADEMFYVISKWYAFNDCETSGIEIKSIISEGEAMYYAGWEPSMVYRYKNTAGETVWCNAFPHWDH